MVSARLVMVVVLVAMVSHEAWSSKSFPLVKVMVSTGLVMVIVVMVVLVG